MRSAKFCSPAPVLAKMRNLPARRWHALVQLRGRYPRGGLGRFDHGDAEFASSIDRDDITRLSNQADGSRVGGSPWSLSIHPRANRGVIGPSEGLSSTRDRLRTAFHNTQLVARRSIQARLRSANVRQVSASAANHDFTNTVTFVIVFVSCPHITENSSPIFGSPPSAKAKAALAWRPSARRSKHG
jgi:hypothetical protein